MFKNITLELSLKPFKQTDQEYITRVCREIFIQWQPLLKKRDSISVLLWVGDGSEILDYDGDMQKPFEWGYFIGTANLPLAEATDDPAVGLHTKTRYYIDNPPGMTYAILHTIIRTLRREAKNAFPAAGIRIGTAFDIGPEFAVSDFKYKRHPEICSGTDLDRFRFVDASSLLNADERRYAAYPHGIPQNTPFASFFGRQTEAYFKDMGFDYIWLSNGLGFSADPWSLTGKIFDGERFHVDKLPHTTERVFSFWKLFRAACRDVPIETRGTNNSVGIDFATDGVPLYDIYKADLNIAPPPNSPWAALNDDYGLEIMGHMSRICELPGKDFLFRYYIHDPWWMNSPWYDRYDGAASDIYLPMAVTRIRSDGSVQVASQLNILTIDNSRGDMPDACVYEPLPHLMKAEKDSADELSFLLWLYPMKEYTAAKSEEELFEMYYADKFMAEAINQGFPLNYVASTDVFKSCDPDFFKEQIIVAPIINDKTIREKLRAFVSDGGKLILYGSEKRLAAYPLNGTNVVKVCIGESPSALRNALENFGYRIRFETQEEVIKLPALTTVRSDNGLFFSVYNPDTTTDVLLKFPLGAPVLLGGEALLCNGFARYRFNRCEHRECRIFIRQTDGIVSAHEQPPASAKYRRKFSVGGLKDATVYYFPERYCRHTVAVTPTFSSDNLEIDEDWTPYYDKVFGYGFKGEHKNGKLAFLMPFKKYV